MKFKNILPAVLALFLLNPLDAPFAYSAEIGGQNHGNIGGDADGARLGESGQPIEDALKQQGIISESTTPQNGSSTMETQRMSDGSTRTVTTNPDGSKTITNNGRGMEPHNLTQTFDKDGNVVSQTGEHTDGTHETMTYDPATGVRESTHTGPNGETTRSTSQRDGSSVTTQTGFSPDIVTTTEDASGNVTQTTRHPDGSRTEESFTRNPPREPYDTSGQPVTTTTTEYDASGKPTRTVRETTARRPGGTYRQTRREETKYDERGKPTETTITAPDGPNGRWITIEEVEYWGNGFRKIIKRRDANGEIIEIYYYDQLGNPERNSINPGHTPGPPPTSGTWFQSRQTSAAEIGVTDTFADNIGTKNSGNTGFGREIAFGDNTQTTEHHDQPSES